MLSPTVKTFAVIRDVENYRCDIIGRFTNRDDAEQEMRSNRSFDGMNTYYVREITTAVDLGF